MTSSAPAPSEGRLVLLRHGPTRWSESGRHTGTTDIPLSPAGEELARHLPRVLEPFDGARVFCSPLVRARRTADLAGLHEPELLDDLREWDYGGYEGLSTVQIRAQLGRDWEVFRDGVIPGATPGESVEQVAARAERVLRRIRPHLDQGDVVLVAHGHLLRILTAVWLGLDPRFGAHLELDAGRLCQLGEHHQVPTIRVWNGAPDAPA